MFSEQRLKDEDAARVIRRSSRALMGTQLQEGILILDMVAKAGGRDTSTEISHQGHGDRRERSKLGPLTCCRFSQSSCVSEKKTHLDTESLFQSVTCQAFSRHTQFRCEGVGLFLHVVALETGSRWRKR